MAEEEFRIPRRSSAETFSSTHLSAQLRIAELEMEISRLQRLVAELLLKNQRLRRMEEA
ncbi:MAG TPA: hypothetical protein VGB69_03875 [Edaphobacter sp.]